MWTELGVLQQSQARHICAPARRPECGGRESEGCTGTQSCSYTVMLAGGCVHWALYLELQEPTGATGSIARAIARPLPHTQAVLVGWSQAFLSC